MDKIYTTFEISRLLSVDITTVMTWVDEGKLQAYKTPGGHRRIPSKDLMDFLSRYRMPVPPELLKDETRVLVVDDDAHLAQLITRALKRAGRFGVETATDGFEAGRKFESFLPDVVLLDLMLPGIDGFDVCRNMRNGRKRKDVKILAMSGEATDENRRRVLSCGADAFLAKPFDADRLVARVSGLLGIGA